MKLEKKFGKICYCKSCGTLDYADKKCPKCGSTAIGEADMDFLFFGNESRRLCAGGSLLQIDTTKFSENIDYCTN